MTLNVEVLYFHTLRDLAGVDSERLELPEGATVADLIEAVRGRRPRLAEATASGRGWIMAAQNQEYAQPDDPVLDGAEIALMPPVSGG